MFIDNLRSLMKAKNVSLSRLASITGIPKSSLHGYLNGAEPSLKNLNLLAEFFEISVDYLYWGRKAVDPIEEVIKVGIHEGLYHISIKKIVKKDEA